MTEHIMNNTTYTHEEWVKAQQWALHTILAGEGGTSSQTAAEIIQALPEPEKPPRTFADMTVEERRDYIGGAVEYSEGCGWYMGINAAPDGRGFHLVFGTDPETGHAKAKFASLKEIVPLPDEPRMTIPGVTSPHVQQEPPADMLGWWATYEGERARITRSKPEAFAGTCRITSRPGVDLWVPVDHLTDWSRERDIEGADNA